MILHAFVAAKRTGICLLHDLQSNESLHEYNDALLHYDLLYHKNPAAMVFPDILQCEVHVFTTSSTPSFFAAEIGTTGTPLTMIPFRLH